MSVEAVSVPREASAQRSSTGFIYVFMAALFIVVAVVGFAPRSLAILSGSLPVPRPIVHLHAALMTGWLLLFMTQTSLMARGRPHVHEKLGLTSLALAPAMFVVMATLATTGFLQLVGSANAAGAAPAPDQLGRTATFVLFIQGRAALLFGLFYAWAVLARRRAPETHKRMMVMATFVVIDAALGRMTWLPGTPPSLFTEAGYDAFHLYQLLLIVPAVAYDVVRFGRVHRAYVVGIGLFLLFIVATHVLWSAQWWHRAVAALAGAG